MTDEQLIAGLRANALWVTKHDAANRIEQLLEDLQKFDGISNELCEKVRLIDEALTKQDLSEHLIEMQKLQDSYDFMKRLWEQEKACAQYAESRVEYLRASLSVIEDISSGTVRRIAKSALINDGQETLDESL